MFEFTITNGEVEISDVDPVTVLYDLEDVKIVEVDFTTKYPGPVSYSTGGGEVTIWIIRGEHSIHLNEKYAGIGARIVFKTPSGERWSVVASAARYTMQLVLYRDKMDEAMGES